MDELVLRGTGAKSRIRFGSANSSTADRVTISGRSGRGRSTSPSVDDAVFGYIRAVRALGRTEVNSIEVARALHLPQSEVDAALHRLRERGVRRTR
jgi:hypothetical protein